ncbi:unnamed protein product [Phytophthora lilii]|uniref:Unnamed protein product n=1 Tax=Phytophthora lilii TaxID=2077276 RepID=A0A9W6TZ79_9STRA|nr:unnamed protein product [Phytophthora lilii]
MQVLDVFSFCVRAVIQRRFPSIAPNDLKRSPKRQRREATEGAAHLLFCWFDSLAGSKTMTRTDEEEGISIDIFNCGSDFSRDCYASMRTPPLGSGSRSASSWTVLSSLRRTAILGEQNATMPLLIRVHDVRVLVGAGVFVAVLMLLVAVFVGGVSVGSRDSVASVNTITQYNFFTGTAAAMLAKPFEMALTFFVPMLTLVLSPRNSLQNDSVVWKTLVFCGQGTLAALLTGAFSTLNVQQLDPMVVPSIVASDLSSSPTLSGSTPSSNDIAFSLQPTADTLLRTATLPVYVKSSGSACQGRGGWPNIATTYAFFANDWLVDLLPNGQEAQGSLYTKVSDNLVPNDIANTTSSSFDSGLNATLSANLLLYAMFFSQTLLAWEGLSYLENSSLTRFQEKITSWREVGESSPASDADFQLAASTMLQNTLSEQSSRLGLDFDVDAVSFNTSHVALSADIAFDAVTIEIPFDEHAIANNTAAWTSASRSASGTSEPLLYRFSPLTDCGETACLISPPDSFTPTATLGDTAYTQWNVEPQIQAFAACIFEDGTEFMPADYLHGASCARRSSTSFLVYSFARRAIADDIALDSSSNASHVVTVTNMQRCHTITMGRLSWHTKDLSTEFNADCGVGEGSLCKGISFLLENASSPTASARHLIVGEGHLPVNSLGEFEGLYSRWTPLAMVTTPTDMQGDLLFQRNVRRGHRQDLNRHCSTSVDVFAAQVEQNHWYMPYGLQESYTAALFLLFQNAVVREEKPSVDGSRSLDFAGSGTRVTLEARIPLASALISIVGSAIVLAGAVCIAVAGRRQQGAIQLDLGVEEVAKVLLVDRHFPRLFLDCALDDPDAHVRRPLHTFRISALVLHQTEPQSSTGTRLFIRYPPHE